MGNKALALDMTFWVDSGLLPGTTYDTQAPPGSLLNAAGCDLLPTGSNVIFVLYMKT